MQDKFMFCKISVHSKILTIRSDEFIYLAGTTFLRELFLSATVEISQSKKIRLKVESPPI